MKSLRISTAFLLLAISTLVLVCMISVPPVFYSLDQDIAKSGFHNNIDTEKRVVINSSTDMLSVMQDILDYSGPIALNIRMQDLESSRNDLDQYAKKYRNLNSLVINLEMNDSEVQDFVNNTKLQDDLYRELMNSSYSLDELKRLEFRYRDKKDSVGLTTIAYQGQALKKKIQSIRDRYHTVNQNIINQSISYELDPTKTQKAREDIDRFVDEITKDIKEEKPEVVPNLNIARKISLIISPDHGVYRDLIMYSGFASGNGANNANVSIWLDNKTYFNTTTNDIGEYRQKIEIGRIQEGTHNVSAHWGSMNSEEMNLTVTSVNSSLTLNITGELFQPVIHTSGLLMTNRSVQSAPIRFIVNNQTWNETRTDNYGNYSLNLTLPEGKYLIHTLFSDRSFPINPSVSPTYEVISSGTGIISIRLLGNSVNNYDDSTEQLLKISIGFIVLFSLGILFWHLKRKSQSRTHIQEVPLPDKKDSVIIPDDIDVQEFFNGNIEDTITQKEELLLSGYTEKLKVSGLSEAARYVYIYFIEKIAGDLQNPPPPLTLTPREVIQKIRRYHYSGIFTLFVSQYERIRYGGKNDKKEQTAFETLMNETDSNLSEKHED
ncbi:hypothetical protein [Methanospirillum lacunae]|uniref:DUF4129 domain-containing protein n=1 Tax=Methanospirillum lacunae TaxID=668570 RepID=A0A2V2N4U3_9EURY|nr:hypothetical protein [Methanospirillum lacunae]PWR72776.1 hypothetical protein DK846_07440 [Methanospirillum lacunae]